jgi:hypothetical protein
MTQLPEPASAQRATAEPAQLVVGILTVRSSYAANTEEPAQGRPDTIQWFIGATSSWRVRTYATDHDIHVHATGALPDDAVEAARAHIRKHYGDVLQELHLLELPAGTTASTAQRMLARVGVPGILEVARAGFAFVNVDSGQYRTKSTPR